MEQRIQLSDHFGFGRLIRFTIPSILMMIFTSIYGVVDGYFVSNFVGKTPFAAVNFIMPFLMVVGAMGFMFGTGGSALIARIMGEGRREKAQEIFSLLIAATFVSGLVIAVISILFLPQIAAFLGAKGEMHADAALLEISLGLLRVKALRAAEDLNVQYRTSMSHRPFAGAVSPASARQRASNSAGRLSAGRLPRPTSSSVPTRMRAM